MLVLRWSLRDKKRTEEVLNNFADLNSRIHENIKLWSLATSIGLDIQHLERLQHDQNSIELGFNVDATLQLAAGDSRTIPGTLELSESGWMNSIINSIKVEGNFGIIHWNGVRYLQENRTYDENRHGSSKEIDARTRDRVDGLAKLLKQPKEYVFCIPRCVGWKYIPNSRQISFAFEIPENLTTQPLSLLRLLEGKDFKPELGDKFQLAFGLARCISQLQMVKWVGGFTDGI